MNQQLLVTVRNVYGNQAIYPLCEQSQIFAQIAGTKTLGESTIRLIKSLGYTFKVQQERVVV